MEKDCQVTAQRKEELLKYCQQRLGGVWLNVDLEKVQFSPISGGLTNYLYSCNLSNDVQLYDGEPRQVLIRIYGEVSAQGEQLIQETVIFALLAERKLAPKLYGFFPGGRLEEFIHGRVLKTSEMQLPNTSIKVAACFAKLHQTSMPICKLPNSVTDKIKEWFELATALQFDQPDRQSLYEEIMCHDLRAIRDHIRDIMESCTCDICFCHNDLQENNIIVCGDPSSSESSFHFIDFEYCGYNYSAFDLGNYFCEWVYDYVCDKSPYFKYCSEDFPSDEQQRNKLNRIALDDSLFAVELKRFQLEVNRMALASHFLWLLWCCIQEKISKIQFGYLEYGYARLKEYYRQIERIKLMLKERSVKGIDDCN